MKSTPITNGLLNFGKMCLVTAAMALTSAPAKAQVQAPNKQPLAYFNTLELDGPVQVTYVEATENSLTIQTANAQQLKTTLVKGRLRVWADAKNSTPVQIMVSGGSLRSITATKGARLWIKNRVSAPEMTVTLQDLAVVTGQIETKGLCQLNIGANCSLSAHIKAANISAIAKENAKVVLSGKTMNASLKTSGTSKCEVRNVDAANWKIAAEDASWVNLYLGTKNKAAITVKDLAQVNYKGLEKQVRLNEDAKSSNSENGLMAWNRN